MENEYYVIKELKNNYYQELDNNFTNLNDAKEELKNILGCECAYNYKMNKDNTYSLQKVIYNSSTDDYEFHEVLPSVSVKDYSYMSYDEKEKYFKGGVK